MTAGCSKCDATWTGTAPAHCTLCHQTFTTVGNFDRHRNGPRQPGRRAPRERMCHDPATCGLEPDHRGFWKLPGGDQDWHP